MIKRSDFVEDWEYTEALEERVGELEKLLSEASIYIPIDGRGSILKGRINGLFNDWYDNKS